MAPASVCAGLSGLLRMLGYRFVVPVQQAQREVSELRRRHCIVGLVSVVAVGPMSSPLLL